MAETPRLELPFPTPDNTADAPRDFEALAERIEALTAWIRTADVIDGAVTPAKLAAAVQEALFAPGDIKATARSTAPDGWLVCDGAAVSRTTYAALFAAIGSAYGAGNGSTTFNLPDLRGRVPAGVDGAAGRLSANDALGQSGGAETHTLTAAQLAAHAHPAGGSSWFVETNTTNAMTTSLVQLASPGVWVPSALNGQFSRVANTGNNTGGDQPHNNMQPYQVVNYMIKT